jgi:hypothetical protein
MMSVEVPKGADPVGRAHRIAPGPVSSTYATTAAAFGGESRTTFRIEVRTSETER